METVRHLVRSEKNKKMGNHSVEYVDNGREFTYHWTVIVKTDDTNYTFTVHDGGYNTSSTNRAISAYVHYLTRDGYELVPEDPKRFTSCEARFIKLDIPEDVVEYSKAELTGSAVKTLTEGTIVKCNGYYIFVKHNGGETLVANEYGNILWNLPRYIQNFVEKLRREAYIIV